MNDSRHWGTIIVAALVAVALSGCGGELDLASAGGDTPAADAGSPETATPDLSVRLPTGKVAAAGIHTVLIDAQSLVDTHRVPGRIDYDAARQMELRVPVECMVKQVLVASGQQVSKEEPLAILSSAEVGLARSTIRQREAELDITQAQSEWVVEVAKNVRQLVDDLADCPEIAQLQDSYQDRPLGEHRDQLLSAYAELLLAQQRASGGQDLQERGVLSGRTLQQRQNDLDVAKSGFQTACEESSRQTTIQHDRAVADVAQAQRMLQVSQEHLQALLGPFSDQSQLDEGALNEFVLCSPIDGTIEQQFVVPAMQLPESEPLFRLANTDVVWACAQIHQRRWAALAVQPGQELQVQSQASPDDQCSAKVKFVGTSVSRESLAIPLVAELENAQHRFKPGMFVWVTVPMSQTREALAVPSAAVVRHEGQAFVFVAEDEETFRRVDVTIGLDTNKWVEITSGLQAGQRVVDDGAFYLKSELFLEHEVD